MKQIVARSRLRQTSHVGHSLFRNSSMPTTGTGRNLYRKTAARSGKNFSPINLNAIPISSESMVRRFRLRPVYVVFLGLWIATSLAYAEPGISSSETARTRAFASIVLVILIGLLLGFGAL